MSNNTDTGAHLTSLLIRTMALLCVRNTQLEGILLASCPSPGPEPIPTSL